MVLLDLTAAFDAVDHRILINNQLVIIAGSALDWFLQIGAFTVSAGEYFMSDTTALSCGIPQGSVLGPISFS